MGLIRGGLVTLCSIALFLALFLTAGFLTISMSLSHDVLKPELKENIMEIINNENIISGTLDEFILPMREYCDDLNISVEEENLNDLENVSISEELNLENVSVDLEENFTGYMQEISGFDIEVPCEIVYGDSEEVLDYIIDDLIEKTYYKEYDCKFFDCFSKEKNPMFVFSNHSKGYFNSLFYKCLIFSLLIAGLIFLFVENKNSFPFIVGIILVVVSLPILLMSRIVSLLVNWEYTHMLGVFFTQSSFVFLIFIILGVVSIGIGILLKFLSFGRFIGRFFGFGGGSGKVSKEQIKSEVREVIQEEKKVSKKVKK